MINVNGDDINTMSEAAQGFYHWFPFAALMVKDIQVPPNRPMATRLIEQAFVGLIAGGGATIATLQVASARNDERILAIKEQVVEVRAQITTNTTLLAQSLNDSNKMLSDRIDRSEQRWAEGIREVREDSRKR